MADETKTEEPKKVAGQYWADIEKRAKAAGMNTIEYLAQAEGGLLRPVLRKLLLHEQAHPDTCPADCAYQASIKRLKTEYGVSG